LSGRHQPVLCEETIKLVIPERGQQDVFIDATFGRGGHSRALLKRLPPAARLIALDRDPAAAAQAAELAGQDSRLTFVHARFSQLGEVLQDLELDRVDAVVMDLGVSSPQLDAAERGFSFQQDGPLDMRMDPSEGLTAAQWLNKASMVEISRVLRDYGEERYARRIARAIIEARPLQTTHQLADLVRRAVPATRGRGKHPATRTFQAIRIFINKELEELEAGLHASFTHLRPGGRLAIISFHSLEDGLVKRAFRKLVQPQELPRRLPVRAADAPAEARIVAGSVRATDAEIQANPRARSASLRVVEKL
jgi:16S rRNA (cytosine1402-N4)-methyltransferase